MTPIIRTARRDDLMQVFHLGREFGAELPSYMPLDETKALQTIDRVFKEGLIIVAEVDGKIVGSIGLIARQWWFSDRWFLGDNWIFVSKDHRKSRIAIQMLKRAKQFADKTGLPLFVDIFSFNQVKRKNRLFRRYFTPIGEGFCYLPENKET